jgi:hypothetical protein
MQKEVVSLSKHATFWLHNYPGWTPFLRPWPTPIDERCLTSFIGATAKL